jgi:predicted ribosome quality control (RQC) complex YloA/Tae2 family protein
MTFDGLTLAAMAVELRYKLTDARVQKVVQPDALTIALETYGNHERRWLLLSADPQRPRVYVVDEKPGRGVETPSPLLLLLRKHVEGLRIGDIVQPPGERILSFAFVSYPMTRSNVETEQASSTLDQIAGSEGDRAPRVHFRLIIEAISQYSNLILVDADGTVLDAARRVSAEQNRYRVTLPRHPYVPPPAQSKRTLAEADAAACRAVLAEAGSGGSVWQAFVAGFAGIGPLAAREIAFRALGDTKARIPADPRLVDDLGERLARAVAEITQPVVEGRFEASIAWDGDAIVAFAPYPLTHLVQWEARPNLSAAADGYYRQIQGIRAVDVARRAVQAAIAADRSLAERKRESLLRALEGTARADELRLRGDLLLTYGTSVPKGASRFHADGVEIELDPRLSAVENAQSYFRRYHKAKAALREVPALLEETELRLRYLDEVAALADLAETVDAVRALRAEIRPDAKPPARQGKRRPVRRPGEGVLRLRASDGAEILIGRSAQQNHDVTFELARPDDVWLHARGCPGAHVIVRVNGGAPSHRTIEEAAALAGYFSVNRESGKVAVDWTRRKFVRRLGKGTPGLVSYSGEQTVMVRPERRVTSDE